MFSSSPRGCAVLHPPQCSHPTHPHTQAGSIIFEWAALVTNADTFQSAVTAALANPASTLYSVRPAAAPPPRPSHADRPAAGQPDVAGESRFPAELRRPAGGHLPRWRAAAHGHVCHVPARLLQRPRRLLADDAEHQHPGTRTRQRLGPALTCARGGQVPHCTCYPGYGMVETLADGTCRDDFWKARPRPLPGPRWRSARALTVWRRRRSCPATPRSAAL
jgi:hypothetical protein